MRQRILAAIVLSALVAGCAPADTLPEPADRPPPEAARATVTLAPTETPLPPTPTATPTRSEIQFDGDRALQHAEAQMAFGPRPTGTTGWRLTGDYIAFELAEAGWEVSTQPFTYMGVEARNIVGAAAAKQGGRLLIIGAHYDTRREADRDAEAPNEPVPGANDGASGVAVLLELARVVDLSAFDGEVWLVFFDAEDNGHLDGWEYIAGSRAFAAALERTPDAVIVVDMVGDSSQQIYREANSDEALTTALWSTASELGYGEYFIDEVGYSVLDDHTPFLEMGIPAVDIIDFDYSYWHTTEDTLDKISAGSLERVGHVLEEFIENGAPLD